MRCFISKYLQKFRTSVKQIDFFPVLNKTNPDNSYRNFNNLASGQFQNCFTQKCSKNTSNSLKWYDKKLYNLGESLQQCATFRSFSKFRKLKSYE